MDQPVGTPHREAGPGCPHFWAETCQLNILSGLQQALNLALHGPALSPADAHCSVMQNA